MSVLFSEAEFERLKDLLRVYEWGQKTLLNELNILYEDYAHFHAQNPIEHIKGRIKSPASIAEKLSKLGLDITCDHARAALKDIAGIRVICQFSRDIEPLVAQIRSLPNIKTLTEKDYVKQPKPSGYRSYHLILEVPVYYSGRTEEIPVEVQVRTEAMDFWATLEHRVRYKYRDHIPAHLCDELVLCADKIAELDERMFLIHDIVSLINA